MRRRVSLSLQSPPSWAGPAGEEQRLRARPEDREQVEVEDQVAAHLEEIGDAGQFLLALDDALGRSSSVRLTQIWVMPKQESLFRVP
jgi:hypothetical protein